MRDRNEVCFVVEGMGVGGWDRDPPGGVKWEGGAGRRSASSRPRTYIQGQRSARGAASARVDSRLCCHCWWMFSTRWMHLHTASPATYGAQKATLRGHSVVLRCSRY